MSVIVDCALLALPAHAAWCGPWLQGLGGGLGRVRLHPLQPGEFGAATLPGGDPPAAILRDAQLALSRYDACLLAVDYATLAWTRTALAALAGRQRVPLLALVEGLQAPAVQDLLRLGLDDFLRTSCPPDDVRARIERQAAQPRRQAQAEAAAPVAPAAPAPPVRTQPAAAGRTARIGHPVRIAARPAPADGADGSPATAAAVPQSAGRRCDEPFRQAKSRIVASFERDYVAQALARHAGNIAMAARASCKHRRAFWALMHKHGIDAAPYREAARTRRAYPAGGPAPRDAGR